MPVHKIEYEGEFPVIWPSADKRVDLTGVTIVGPRAAKSDRIKLALQTLLDYRVPRSSMPDDEPTKTADPAQPNFFWDGGDIVARSVIVEAAVWDGERFSVTLKRAR